MRIDSKTQIAGHSSILVRKLLRRSNGFEWSVGLAQEVLRVTELEAERVLSELARLGFVQKTEVDGDGITWWQNTVQGNALMNATAASPIKRHTAERTLRDFLARVREVNSNAAYFYSVTYAVVFGSYLSDKETINDVDIAIELQHKELDPERRKAADREKIRAAIHSGRRFGNILQELMWPRTEVWLKLKSRSRSLSLHELGDEAGVIKGGPFQVVFAKDSAHPIPDVLR